MDAVVILLILEECKQRFPIRYQRIRDNMLLLRYAEDFEYHGWNQLADLDEKQIAKRRKQGKRMPDPPVVLSVDDDAYE